MSFRLSRQPRLGQAVVCEELACCDGALPGAAARDRRRPPRAGELLGWWRLVRMAPTSSFQCAASPPATPPGACVKLRKEWSLLLVKKRRKVVTMESAPSMAPPSHRRTCAPVTVSSHACARRGRAQPPHRCALQELAGSHILLGGHRDAGGVLGGGSGDARAHVRGARRASPVAHPPAGRPPRRPSRRRGDGLGAPAARIILTL